MVKKIKFYENIKILGNLELVKFIYWNVRKNIVLDKLRNKEEIYKKIKFYENYLKFEKKS